MIRVRKKWGNNSYTHGRFICLHFSEKIAYKVYDEFQEKYIKKLDDGTLEVTFRYQLSDWTFLYLLSFGEYVEIIEPVEARNILKEKARKILALYQNSGH